MTNLERVVLIHESKESETVINSTTLSGFPNSFVEKFENGEVVGVYMDGEDLKFSDGEFDYLIDEYTIVKL